MKRLELYLIMYALFFSCAELNNSLPEEDAEEEVIHETVVDIRVLVAVVDEEYNDLLNPQSSVYLGDEYTSGIEVLYLVNGEKLTFLEYYYNSGGGYTYIIDNVENIKAISPPYRYVEGYGETKSGTLGYYFIDCTSVVDPITTQTFIRYPDGSEDEIKVEIYRDGYSLVLIENLWVNGELAYKLHTDSGSFNYYNPKYFPFLIPVPSMGDKVMPKTPDRLIWLVKPQKGSN